MSALYTHAMDLGLAMPAPPHTLTPAAEEAREAARRIGAERRRERAVASLVTEHGHKRLEPYDGGIPAAAKRTMSLAETHGFRVMLVETAVGCRVDGIHDGRRVGFRAYWTRGRTAGGTWHSGGRDTYRLIDISDRPIGKDAKALTTKARCRHDEKDRTRLVLVESPRGVSAGITEIERRIAS